MKEKKVKHNWTKKTLPQCAEVHMDQILNAFYNYSGKEKTKEIGRLLLQAGVNLIDQIKVSYQEEVRLSRSKDGGNESAIRHSSDAIRDSSEY